MGWNDPDKNKDSFGGKGQPPDLDEALKQLQSKLKKALFGGGKGNNAGNSSGGAQPPGDVNKGGGILFLLVFGVALVLWALSGIFIVDPAEQAVILRFGKYIESVGPGPHWIPRIIDSKIVRNVERVMDYSYSANMLTKDENLVAVSLVVQYRIGDLEDYLFNVTDPQGSLQQATSSALRQVVGTTTLDQLITEGREVWSASVEKSLISILNTYKAGIHVVNVSPQPARAPENVQDAFDDAIKAQEDEKRFKEQARAYEAQFVPRAEGQAKRLIEEAQAYAQQVVFKARGEVAEFLALLPRYQSDPKVTSDRMYLDTMQTVLQQSSKIIVDNKSGNLMYLPLEKMMTAPPPLKTINEDGVNSDNADQRSGGDSELVGSRPLLRQTYRTGGSN
ncbi:MAG: FtsH protease activity modulator HflK [Legionellaceae bacterium]|nr:FtsH protease activity modulator HflK [Legionellaceae bacterium]